MARSMDSEFIIGKMDLPMKDGMPTTKRKAMENLLPKTASVSRESGSMGGEREEAF